MVFFIGGCTFAEISALRFLSQQEDCEYYATIEKVEIYSGYILDLSNISLFSVNVEFVVGTTRLINGDTFLTSLMEDLEQT